MTNIIDKHILLKRLRYVAEKLREYESKHPEQEAYILGGLKVVTDLEYQIRNGLYDAEVGKGHLIGCQTGRFSSSETNLSAEPKSGPPVVNGHALYTKEDFKDMTGEELESSYTAHLVLDGGLAICKICGEGEAGLDNPCKPEGEK
ncbi:hypothetical protein N374_gp171 [Bacillus phage phiNIT1]|uniref:Uncharacterized protein n=1 Tax=Bacillus phage phiNIT1 TaxID=207656 RepID=S6BV34_9CAUD|nr:hypothetical protein N374_gp171 [Bacillus phage phiNIT1]BAN59660.1 hypothetical protein [Bacillus phage phiNIT1]